MFAAEMKKKLAVAKKIWRKEQSSKAERDPALSWRQVKQWIGWEGTSSPKQLVHKNELISSPSKIAQTMNDFYFDKVKTI